MIGPLPTIAPTPPSLLDDERQIDRFESKALLSTYLYDENRAAVTRSGSNLLTGGATAFTSDDSVPRRGKLGRWHNLDSQRIDPNLESWPLGFQRCLTSVFASFRARWWAGSRRISSCETLFLPVL